MHAGSGVLPNAAEEFRDRLVDHGLLFLTGVDGLFADDLDDGLGQAVAIDQREHFLLDGGGSWILSRAAPGGGDDGFADLCQFQTPLRLRMMI